ncbi:SMP protein, partial [Nothoprocta ornata]|nr:SMP protein [Nothoprocta ornata]
PTVLPASRCSPAAPPAPGGAPPEGLRCLCAAAGSPPPAVAFELPGRNATVGPGHPAFAPGPPDDLSGDVSDDVSAAGVTVTALLTLRGPLEPRLAVLCSARNGLGAAGRRLRFHHAEGLVWAKVGPVGAVVAFAVVIAAVCYVSQSRRRWG